MKQFIIALILVMLGGLAYWFLFPQPSETPMPEVAVDEIPQQEVTEEPAPAVDSMHTRVATSTKGHPIVAHHFGTGEKEVLFVGGIHGGYEWNTTLVAYELMDYLTAQPSAVPEGFRVTVVPVLNPDGLEKVVGTTSRFAIADVPKDQNVQISGRVNGSGVDLNRNFDCDWKSTGTWRNTPVKGGSAPFSEPESNGMKDYIESRDPVAVVVWFSAAGGVYSSSCDGTVSPETSALTKAYASGSGYGAFEKFDAYAVNGDMTNWLAKKGIPAISVLLATHDDVEWIKNQNGIKAVLQHLSQ